MDSGLVNQCVPGGWLGQGHADVPLLWDLPGSSGWERLLESPTLWGFRPCLRKKVSPGFLPLSLGWSGLLQLRKGGVGRGSSV